ncbi:MAG: nitroreductase family protein [Spirochaetaceae bacterium]|nr:nitroreductase family protein [Spirochaetaceae bacterium]
MEMLSELKKRRSFRAISPEPVEKDVISRLLTAATLAPSCFNNQPWRIIVVEKSPDNPHYPLVAATLSQGNFWALEAPLIFAFATGAHLDCRLDEGRDYAYFDLGQAAMALQMQAQKEGLYAHPIAGYSAPKLRLALKLPPEFLPLCLIIAGWPGDAEKLPENLRAGENAPRARKPLGDVAFSEYFGASWQ